MGGCVGHSSWRLEIGCGSCWGVALEPLGGGATAHGMQDATCSTSLRIDQQVVCTHMMVGSQRPLQFHVLEKMEVCPLWCDFRRHADG